MPRSHAGIFILSNIEAEGLMKFLHTMIRVNDLDESLKFYCDVLGMKLIRKGLPVRQVHAGLRRIR